MGEASADVMYNTYDQYPSNIGSNGEGDDGYTGSDYGAGDPVAWVGANAGALPFGLTTDELHFANWAVQLNSAGAGEIISSQNAHDQYGVWADLDTTQGAWTDAYGRGTMYSMDLGLIKSDVTQQVTMSVSNIDASSWQTFGISVYNGGDLHPHTQYEYTHDACCDANGNPVPIYGFVDYDYLSTMSHYGYWGYDSRTPFSDNPFGSNIDYLTSGEASTVTFTAEAGEIYVVLLGGNSGGIMYGDDKGYAVDITSSPVPLPSALWLFAGVMPFFVGMRRRCA